MARTEVALQIRDEQGHPALILLAEPHPWFTSQPQRLEDYLAPAMATLEAAGWSASVVVGPGT